MNQADSPQFDYDYIIIGSGFGGSVSALRLSEKGYKVLVIEKGRWFKSEDFPKTNWNIKRWLWIPYLKAHGIMRMRFFRHLNVLSGVGVGGGSLVFACTLPQPKSQFFQTGSWAKLNDWEQALAPHYAMAYKMLGAQTNPKLCAGDLALEQVAHQLGRHHEFAPSKVAIFFAREGEQAGQTVPDPYFDGQGPDRASCLHCGACMTGCRHNAKNSLDKNYLYFAQKRGADIWAETLVQDVRPLSDDGAQGYEVHVRDAARGAWLHGVNKRSIRTRGVVFSAGAMGTNELLLQLKRSSMPHLSERVGRDIRSNNECLIAVTTADDTQDFSQGIAIGSVLHTDDDSHLEPVRYGAGSGAWRLALAPMAYGANVWVRLVKMAAQWARHPLAQLRILFVKDWAKHSQIMLFMQHLDSTLQFKLNRFGGMSTAEDVGAPPSAFIPQADKVANMYATQINGKTFTMFTEQLFNVASTAHLLGGAVMGADASSGVIDATGHVFGYQNALVCDGSMISANLGVNPSLSITAIAEYIMANVPPKSE